MVVEDDPHLCDILVAFIKKCDYGACGAYTGQEASELFKRIRPDLVILDLKLPDTDGLQLLQKFKRSDPHCKVVILSTYSGTDTVVEAMKLGAENYLTKPTPLPELRLLIDTLLDLPSQDARPLLSSKGSSVAARPCRTCTAWCAKWQRQASRCSFAVKAALEKK